MAGLRINTNIQALAGQRHLSGATSRHASVLEKLSSGSRITRAADDAAGLAISENIKASVRSLRQAERNTQDGIGLVQVAEGAMNEVTNIIIRIRELAIQASSDTVGDVERGFIDKEVLALRDEVERIAVSTEYNGMKLLDGAADDLTSALDIQVGVHDSQLDRLVFDRSRYNVTTERLGMSRTTLATKEDAQEQLSVMDNALEVVSKKRAWLGAMQNRMNSIIANNKIYQENLSASRSRIADADIAEFSSELTKESILKEAGIVVLAQANVSPRAALRLVE